MSIRFLHQVIIFAAMSVALLFAGWCFFSPDTSGDPRFMAAGGACVLIAIGLVFYEVHFLKRTSKIIIH
jgi:hypothetical protein